MPTDAAQAPLVEVLNQIQQGVLWISHGGRVRHANPQAVCSTGLRRGDALPAGDLLQAVAAVVHHRVAREATLVGQAPTAAAAAPQWWCRVLPGLEAHDALVVLGHAVDDPALDARLLMNLLGRDLSAPLRQAQAALSVARSSGDEHSVDALVDAVEGLLQGLDGVVALADLWDAPASPRQDRLDLVPLLRAAWAEVQTLAHDRHVSAHFACEPQPVVVAPVYGHPAALQRVLRECLAAALQATLPGGTLRVAIRQQGPRVQIVFLGCRPFDGLPPREAPHLPPRRGRADARRVPQQLAWHLCRRLLALHGGQLREEAAEGARNFMIDLPSGAPFPVDNPSLDMAQAHRYAHDLAALMARHRRLASDARPGATEAPHAASRSGSRVPVPSAQES